MWCYHVDRSTKRKRCLQKIFSGSLFSSSCMVKFDQHLTWDPRHSWLSWSSYSRANQPRTWTAWEHLSTILALSVFPHSCKWRQRQISTCELNITDARAENCSSVCARILVARAFWSRAHKTTDVMQCATMTSQARATLIERTKWFLRAANSPLYRDQSFKIIPLISWVTNYSLILARNFSVNL